MVESGATRPQLARRTGCQAALLWMIRLSEVAQAGKAVTAMAGQPGENSPWCLVWRFEIFSPHIIVNYQCKELDLPNECCDCCRWDKVDHSLDKAAPESYTGNPCSGVQEAGGGGSKNRTRTSKMWLTERQRSPNKTSDYTSSDTISISADKRRSGARL